MRIAFVAKFSTGLLLSALFSYLFSQHYVVNDKCFVIGSETVSGVYFEASQASTIFVRTIFPSPTVPSYQFPCLLMLHSSLSPHALNNLPKSPANMVLRKTKTAFELFEKVGGVLASASLTTNADDVNSWSPPDLIDTMDCHPSLSTSTYITPETETSSSKKKRKKQSIKNKNFEELARRPATTFLLLINTVVAFTLKTKQIPPTRVAISYNNFLAGETYRAFTASFSHYEIMHFGFNMLTTYNLGGLEEFYGSLPYLIINFALVVLTSLCVVLISHRLIATQPNPENRASQTAVGYSCVLFANIVIATSLQDTYCPIPMFDNFCFKTWHLGVLLGDGFSFLKFNPSPFILLFLTQFIMPRASFVGHLAGILIGYLISWAGVNTTSFLDPTFFVPLTVVADCFFRSSRNTNTNSITNNDDSNQQLLVAISTCSTIVTAVFFSLPVIGGQAIITYFLRSENRNNFAVTFLCGMALPFIDAISVGNMFSLFSYVKLTRQFFLLGEIDVSRTLLLIVYLFRIATNVFIGFTILESANNTFCVYELLTRKLRVAKQTPPASSQSIESFSGRGRLLQSSQVAEHI